MNAIEQLKMIKIQKKLLLKKKRELQNKFLVEKAKLTEEYARNLEALIEGQFDDAVEDVPFIRLSLPVEPIEDVIEDVPEDVSEPVVENVVEDVVEIVSEPVVENAAEAVENVEPINEPVVEVVKSDLKKQLVNFLMKEFVNKEKKIDYPIDDFLELFQKWSNDIVGKNTFTKELKGLGLWHFKSNDVRKYKCHYDDLKRSLISFLSLYDEDLVIENQVIKNEEDEEDEVNFLDQQQYVGPAKEMSQQKGEHDWIDEYEGDILEEFEAIMEDVEIQTKKKKGETKKNEKIEKAILAEFAKLESN